jgi:hypothetical protein
LLRLNTNLLLAVFVIELIALLPSSSGAGVMKGASANGVGSVVAVWNEITFDQVGVRSRNGGRLVPDCIRVGAAQLEVDCFSIQQNFWISNSKGELKFWVQNAVQLAELNVGEFFGTYVFTVWNVNDSFSPIFCDPSSLFENYCRAPLYTESTRFPQSFIFYSSISNQGDQYILKVENNFAARSWEIPTSAGCPCSIETVLKTPPPWGHYPFELVAVGLDSAATAYFKTGTNGSVGPGFVENGNGVWRRVTLDAFRCLIAIDCPTMAATGESSRNLKWDNASGKFYWSEGAYDQGVFISSISNQPSTAPLPPQLVGETYLYIRMGLRDMAFLTVVDSFGKSTGYNASSGKIVQNIPRSVVTQSDEQGVIIVNPDPTYQLELTPVGSGPFHILLKKTSNLDDKATTTRLDGNVKAWEPKYYSIDVDALTINQEDNSQSLLLFASVGAGIVIASALVWQKRRIRKRSSTKMNQNQFATLQGGCIHTAARLSRLFIGFRRIHSFARLRNQGHDRW